LVIKARDVMVRRVSIHLIGRHRLLGFLTAFGLAVGLVNGIAVTHAVAVIEPSACSISGALTARFASTAWGDSLVPSFVQFQVSNGSATYAGVAQTRTGGQDRIQLIVSRGGRTTFLDTYVESPGSFEPVDGSMRAVGFDSHGGVVAAIQRPGTSYDYLHTNGWRYDLTGRKWLLQDSPLWTSVQPIGVAASGMVVGNVRRGKVGWGTSQVAVWTGTGRGTVRVLTSPGTTAIAVDQRGDIFYYDNAHGHAYVLQPGGVRNELVSFRPVDGDMNVDAQAASVASGFGVAGTMTNNQLAARWNVPVGSSAPIAAQRLGYLVWIDSVGFGNDIVGEYPGNPWPNRGSRVLVRSSGKAYRLPVQFREPYGDEPHTVLNRYGQVVYTGTDGLPHLMTCPA
jgi:hypothetical protein